MVRSVFSPPTASLIPILLSVCAYVCACMDVYLHMSTNICMLACIMFVCVHLHMHICVLTFKPSSELMFLKSHKISISKKMVVFSVFLPENYLDEVASDLRFEDWWSWHLSWLFFLTHSECGTLIRCMSHRYLSFSLLPAEFAWELVWSFW